MPYLRKYIPFLTPVVFVLLLLSTCFASPGLLRVSFIDVGQGDSILIQSPGGNNMLIDAGTPESYGVIDSYLHHQGIKRLDVIIATHPHSDHIGSMPRVIKSFEIGQVFMPKGSNNTRNFEDLLNAIKGKNLKIKVAKAGVIIDLDPALKVQLLAPNSDHYENLNDYSAVTKITYNKTSFLLTGDAQTVSEQEMLKNGMNLKADLLKVGHHGSRSSTSAFFLKAVSPKYAVISLGAGNSYGHPHAETLQKLEKVGVKFFRTDHDGTILASSDGIDIKINKKASSVNINAPSIGAYQKTSNESSCQDITVYITCTGHKYHNEGCRYLARSSIPIALKEAKEKGYEPCSVCRPPE